MKKLIGLSAMTFAAILATAHAQAQDNEMPMREPGIHHPGNGTANGQMPQAGMMGGAMGMMGAGMGKMMIVMMDTNDDGMLSLDEFLAVHTRMFKAIDADGDDQISAKEMAEFHGGE